MRKSPKTPAQILQAGKSPVTREVDAAPEVVRKIQAKLAEARQKLAEITAKLQGEADGYMHALLQQEVERLGIPPNFKYDAATGKFTITETPGAVKPAAVEKK